MEEGPKIVRNDFGKEETSMTVKSLKFHQTIRVNAYGCRSSFKEVIQPQVPLGLPCYDFTPVMNHKVVTAPPEG